MGSRPSSTVYCPECGASPGKPCAGRSGPHPARVDLLRRWRLARKHRRRKAGKNGSRLERTRAPSAEIVAKQRQIRRPKPVTVRYECPICGGDHPRTDCPTP